MSVSTPGTLPELDPASQATSSRRWLWRDILLPLLLTRLLLTLVGFHAVNNMPLAKEAPYALTVTEHAWVTCWARWDSVWYLRIARNGYFCTPGQQSSIAFSPLYPLLMRLGGLVPGHRDIGMLLTGVAVSNLLLLAAMVYLWKLVRLDFDEATARRAVLYALIIPWTLFLSAVYPMSLILAIVLGAFYYARTAHWKSVAILAALAPLSRPDGILLTAGLLFEYLHQRQFQWRQIRWDIAPLLLLPTLTQMGWLAYQDVRFGDALAFVHVQRTWPRYSLHSALHDWDSLTGLAALLAGTALLIYGWFTLRRSYLIYASLQWLLLVSVARVISAPRFMLVLFPIYLVLARFGRNERFDQFWILLSMGTATVMFVRFALCHFVG